MIASSDDHLGYPGAYGEGLAGVGAEELSREAVLEAIWKRRTIAATGDRIRLQATLNGEWMGSEIPFAKDRRIEVEAEGKDEIERIDILRNNRVVYRYFPEDHYEPGQSWPEESLCRIELGWGPWADLNMARVADWDLTATIEGGEILDATPCYQSGPFEEDRRDRITERTESKVSLQVHTSRLQAYEDAATKSLILRLAGPPSAKLTVELRKPVAASHQYSLGSLAEENEVEFTGQFTTESFLVHRLVPPDLSTAKCAFSDKGREGDTDWYYARVTQANGHQAWSSPIWVEGG